jgi:hypothetical protein
MAAAARQRFVAHLPEAASPFSPAFLAALRREGLVVNDTDEATVVLHASATRLSHLAKACNQRALTTGGLEAPYPWADLELESAVAAGHMVGADGAELVVELVHRVARSVPPSEREAHAQLELFPLHNPAAVRECWASALRARPALDADLIRRYFGADTASYFEFMAHYNRLLLIPAVASLVPFCAREFANTAAAHPMYALLAVVWATVFCRLWQRRQSFAALRCGMLCDGLSLDTHDVGGTHGVVVEDVRTEYRGTPRTNPITGLRELYYPTWRRRYVLRPLTWLAVAAYVVPCLLLQVLSLNFQGYMSNWRAASLRVESIAQWADPGAVLDPNGAAYWYLGPVTLHVCGVFALGKLFRPVARRLTEWENHRTIDEYHIALIEKRVVFEFIDCYFALFFVAFFLWDVDLLRGEFASLFAVDTVRRVSTEALLPWVGLKLEGVLWQRGKGGHDHDEPKQSSKAAEAAEVRRELAKEEYDSFDDFLEMVVQFGYVAMFASAFPLAALFSWLGNVIEVRSDAFKVCWLHRRPVPLRTAACKPWTGLVEGFAFLAVAVNCLLIVVTAHNREAALDEYLPEEYQSAFGRFRCAVGLEHALIVVVLALRWMISPVPHATKIHVARLKWQRRKRDKS